MHFEHYFREGIITERKPRLGRERGWLKRPPEVTWHKTRKNLLYREYVIQQPSHDINRISLGKNNMNATQPLILIERHGRNDLSRILCSSFLSRRYTTSYPCACSVCCLASEYCSFMHG